MNARNRKLIGQGEALELAGAEPLAWVPSEIGMVLRHLPCGKSCGVWALGHQTTADDMVAAVLRHMVTAHDLPLNRAERERRAGDERASRDRHPTARGKAAAEPGTTAPDRGDGAAPGGAAPRAAGRRVRRKTGETGGDRA